MRVFFILLVLVSSAYGEGYDEHFDSNGSEQNYNDYFEDVGDGSSIQDILNRHYDAVAPDNTVPTGAVDMPTGSENGFGTASGVSGKLSNEGGLKSTLKNMQTGGNLETLGETYVCLADNVTYTDKNDCRSSCSGACDTYKFNVELSCQRSEEIIKITPVNMLAANTPLNIVYDGATYTTLPVTAVCVNGYMSGKNGYIWDISNSGLQFTVVPPNAPASAKYALGQCRDLSGKNFMGYFQDYYRDMGYALEANVAKLGYVASHTINSDMSLSVNVLKAGACDKNALQSGLPNRAAIDKMKEGQLNPSEAATLSQTDEHFKLITSGSDQNERSCISRTNVSLVSEHKAASGSGSSFVCTEDYYIPRIVRLSNNAYALDGLDGFKYPHHACDWAVNIDPPLTADSWHRLSVFENGAALTDMNVTVSISLPGCNIQASTTLNDAHTQSGSILKCKGYWPASEGTRARVFYSYSYNYMEDLFSVQVNNGCSAIPQDCKLMSESVCDMYGNNCVKVLDKGMPTGAKANKFCNEVSTATDKYVVCSNGTTVTAKGSNKSFSGQGGFFVTNRTYSCPSGKKEYDYSLFIKQDNTVSDTLNVSASGDVRFEGIGMGGGKETYRTNLSLTEPACNQTCKVKAPVSPNEDRVVINNGEAVQTKLAETSYYKSCTKKDDKWSCQLEGNETLVQGCGCPDDFVDTVIRLKLISESSGSLKCSSK